MLLTVSSTHVIGLLEEGCVVQDHALQNMSLAITATDPDFTAQASVESRKDMLVNAGSSQATKDKQDDRDEQTMATQGTSDRVPNAMSSDGVEESQHEASSATAHLALRVAVRRPNSTSR